MHEQPLPVDRERVVVVARILGVDGEGEELAKVCPTLAVGHLGQRRRLCEDVGGEGRGRPGLDGEAVQDGGDVSCQAEAFERRGRGRGR